MRPHFQIKPLLFLICLTFPTTIFADGNNASEATELEQVLVKGKRQPQEGSRLDSGSKDVLDETALKSTRSISLGQTVEKISGVQNSSFGPNNGLPQIRSLGGTRVKVMENGLGVSDMAAVSGNLPTAVQPFLADKITVHKSSVAVLYGGNAIGGAVNVETGQIPSALPEKPFGGKVEISGGYNTPHTEILSLDGKAGKLAWHIDGFNSKISHYRIPGYSKASACYEHVGKNLYFPLSSACQFEVRYNYFFNKGFYRYVDKNYLDKGEAWRDAMGLSYADLYRETKPNFGNWVENPLYDPSITEGNGRSIKSITHITPNEKGRLTNSHMHNRSFSAGASYIGDQGYVGIGVSRYLNDYGMPGYSSYNTHVKKLNGALPANVSAAQTRWTGEAMYRPGSAWFNNIKAQFAHTDAKNREFLGSYFVSSINSRSNDLRVEFNHKAGDFLRGSAGIDWRQRRTDGLGADRFLPDTRTRAYGVFALEKFRYRSLEAEVGARVGKVSHTPDFTNFKPSRNYGGSRENKKYNFDLHSHQLALAWQPLDAWRISLRRSRSQRAPDINELFAGNLHFSTFASENGDTDLKKETAKTWEIGNEITWRNTKFKAAYYHTAFDDYIYLGHSGVYAQWLPIRYWQQGDTKIRGFELELTQAFNLKRYGSLEARLFADLVKNSPVDKPACTAADARDPDKWKKCVRIHNQGDYMPGLPASRYGIGLEWSKGNWQVGSSLTRYTSQKRRGKAVYEEADLGGYNIWDAYIAYSHKLAGDRTLEWFVDARNLGNVEARPHNSTLKYLAPLPGRSLRTGLRFAF